MSSSYSSPNGEIVVSPLVPQAAIDAAREAFDCGEYLEGALEAAAPRIGAEAIRWAIEQPFSSVLETPNEKLRRLADALEAGDN